MDQGLTTVAVQRYLDDLAAASGDMPSEPIVRELLARAVDRLHLICGRLLHQGYPRLTRGPVNYRSEELLGAVVERMLKAMRTVRPQTVRQFFALANQHIRWELNDMARRLDGKAAAVPLPEHLASPEATTGSAPAGTNLRRIFEAIENLPEDEREVFQLVRIQGMTKPEAAEVTGVSVKTIHRRLNRCLLALTEQLGDLGPGEREMTNDQEPKPNQ